MLNDYPQLLYIQNWVAKFGYMYRDIQLNPYRDVYRDGACHWGGVF